MLRQVIVLVPLLALLASGLQSGKEWKYLGCFGDNTGDRALPTYYRGFSLPANGQTANFKDVVEICRAGAEEKGFDLFGLQYERECWGAKKGANYAKYGKTQTCIRGEDGYYVGQKDTNAIWMLKVDGGFSRWSAFSSCGKTCGVASQERTRTCTNPKPLGYGEDCVGSRKETRSCKLPSCSVDGGWSKFSGWSQCEKSCNGGIVVRTRTCTNPPPADQGRQCVGPAHETKTCNTNPCPVNGGWTHYDEWSTCSVKCGKGTQSRRRSCSNPPPSHGGKQCGGPSQETRPCTGKNCEVGTRDNPGKSCKDIKARGGTQTRRYWITVGGKTFQVYCDQSTDGGGWTLVYSFTFTNFNRFKSGSNAITPRPNWPAPGNVRVSTTAPASETDYNALDFNLWKQLGSEFMIKSNINNWISCREGSGSLINWRNGGIHCRIVNNYTHKCGNVVPNEIKMRVHDSFGWHELGPNIHDTRVKGGWLFARVLKTYYYLETSTSGVNWPTHDPCGKNQLNHLRSHNPHSNIYVR